MKLDTVKQERKYPRRKRVKSTNTKTYVESNSSGEDSDNNYEPETKRFRGTKVNQKKKSDLDSKSMTKTENFDDINDGGIKDDRDNLVNFGLVSRPNLSESDSSDDETNIAQLKESLKAKNNQKVFQERTEIKVDIKNDGKMNEIKAKKKPVARIEKLEKGESNDLELNNKKTDTETIAIKQEKLGINNFLRDENETENNKVNTNKNKKENKSKQIRKPAKLTKVMNKSDGLDTSDNKLVPNKRVRAVRVAPEKKTPSRVSKQQKTNPKTSLKATGKTTKTKPKSKKQQKEVKVSTEHDSDTENGLFEDVMDCQPGPSGQKMKAILDMSKDDDSEDDWQDVNEADVSKIPQSSPKKKVKTENDVKDVAISLQVKSVHKSKSEKNKELYKKFVERTMRKFHQDLQENKHKTHLLCLIARTQFLSQQCNDASLQAVCLSLVPMNITKVPKNKWDIQQLKKLVNWCQSGIPNTEKILPNCEEADSLRNITRIQVFVALLRSLGFNTRIVTSLQPLSPKVTTLFRLNSKESNTANKEAKGIVKENDSKENSQTNPKPASKTTASSKKQSQTKPQAKKNLMTAISPYFDESSEPSTPKKDASKTVKTNQKPRTSRNKKRGNSPIKNKEITPNTKQEPPKQNRITSQRKGRNSDNTTSSNRKRGSAGRSIKRKKLNYAESEGESGIESQAESSNEAMHSDDSDFIETPRRSLSAKLSAKADKSSQKAKRSKIENRKSLIKPYESKLVDKIDDDSDFERTSKPLVRKNSNNNKSSPEPVRVMSSDTDAEEPKQKKKKQNLIKTGHDVWAEVYLTSEKKWICVELNGNTVDDAKKYEKMATQPLQYVIGIDNRKAIKDITSRYATDFMTKTRKLQIAKDWWTETLKPYKTRDKKLNEIEDTELRMDLMRRPFPTSVAAFKSHPLYVLEGDLLKFEAIYPESAPTLGYVHGKAIYSRDCVHILHTRENWLKEARVVKKGEEAYKIVRGRPKRSTPIHERDKVKIDLFGLWQTEIYKPPPVKDGKVPRNEYGNVELFKACMLPPGAVHIPIQGIHKVARKLSIDAAPAMMGWDFHSGCAHPIIEGVVVAKEFEEKLLDAWQKAEEEIAIKKHEKKLQKIYERWKLLVKGMLVRERIKRKYDFREQEEIEPKKSNKEDKNTAADLSVCWPLNKMEGKTSLNEKGHCHIFPESGYKQDKVTGEWTKGCSCGLRMPFEKL